MYLRRSGLLALALILGAGCPSVSQRDPVPTVYLAAFDPTQSVVPVPNDVALFFAPAVSDLTKRGQAFFIIGQNGWPMNQRIAIPLRTLAYDAANDRYVPAAPPPGIDGTTVNAQTVAIVKTNGTPTVLAPGLLTYLPNTPAAGLASMVIAPISGGLPANFSPGTYTVAVRGGALGVKTTDGLPLDQDVIPALLAANKDVTNPENQPPGGIPEAQAALVERIRQTLDAGTLWGVPPPNPPVTTGAQCNAVYASLGLGITTVPEGTCWLPLTAVPTITDAYAAIDLVFPHEQAVSIQTFTVANWVTP